MKITENVKFCKGIKVRDVPISANMIEITSKKQIGTRSAYKKSGALFFFPSA
jgi:hypothetical protein